jgi:hypothetical protein
MRPPKAKRKSAYQAWMEKQDGGPAKKSSGQKTETVGYGGSVSTIVSVFIIALLASAQISNAVERTQAAERTAEVMVQKNIRMFVDLERARRVVEHLPPMSTKELAEETRKHIAPDGTGICIGNGLKILTLTGNGEPTTSQNSIVTDVADKAVEDQINCGEA